MAQTPNTSATAYLTVAEFVKRADLRTVGDLVSDNGVRVASSALTTDPNLAAALLDASGLFEAGMLRGQRYQPADINALITAGGAGVGLIYRLLTDLVQVLLWQRRPDMGPVPEQMKWVDDFMEKLASGERILPFLETQAAGVLASDQETPSVVDNRYLTTRQAYGLFGDRNNRSQGTFGGASYGRDCDR